MMRTVVIGVILCLTGLQCQAQQHERVVIEDTVGSCPDKLFLRIEVPKAGGGFDLIRTPAPRENCQQYDAASVNVPEVSKKAQEFLGTYAKAYGGQTTEIENYRNMWLDQTTIPPLPKKEDCGIKQSEALDSWATRWSKAGAVVLGWQKGVSQDIPSAMKLGAVARATFVDVTLTASSSVSSISEPIPGASVQFELAVSCERRLWAETSWEWLLEEVPPRGGGGLKEYRIKSQVRR
jgi:hypothetical protein